jgi:hypothetical protein
MEKIRAYLGYAIGTLIASPVLYVILGFFWAIVTPIDVEKVIANPDPSITRLVRFQSGRTTLEFSEQFWMMSGSGWLISMERRATCHPSNEGVACFRYGSPYVYADFVKMAHYHREEERLRHMHEEASKKGPTT